MSIPVKLFIDIQARRLVLSDLATPNVPGPLLRQGETVAFQLYFLDSTGATPGNPYPAFFTPAGLTIKMGVCATTTLGTGKTVIAFQDTWTPISNGYAGNLDCATVDFGTALATVASLAGTLEIEYTESGGSPVKPIITPCQLQAAVIQPTSTIPTPTPSYPTRNEANATYARFINLAGASIILVSPDGLSAIECKCGNDGSFITAQIDPP